MVFILIEARPLVVADAVMIQQARAVVVVHAARKPHDILVVLGTLQTISVLHAVSHLTLLHAVVYRKLILFQHDYFVL